MAATLGLGTAQFGMPYGVTNGRGQCSPATVADILSAAAASGVAVLDTAPDYGDAERVVGGALPARQSFRIVTKTIRAPGDVVDDAAIAAVRGAFLESLVRLRQTSVYGLLVHHAADLVKHGGERLVRLLEDLKRERTVTKHGVSVYDGEQIDAVLERFTPDIVQLPLNALDQRLVHSGHLARLAASGVEVHVRSVFMQGLLLSAPDALPERVRALAREPVAAFQAQARAAGATPAEAAMSAARRATGVDVVLAGVTSVAEFDELRSAWDRSLTTPFTPPAWRAQWQDLVDPRKWPRH